MLVLLSILTFLVASGSMVRVPWVDKEQNEHQTSQDILPRTIEHMGTEMEPMSRSFCNATQPITLPLLLAGGRVWILGMSCVWVITSVVRQVVTAAYKTTWLLVSGLSDCIFEFD
jgi:hypothetical protein